MSLVPNVTSDPRRPWSSPIGAFRVASATCLRSGTWCRAQRAPEALLPHKAVRMSVEVRVKSGRHGVAVETRYKLIMETILAKYSEEVGLAFPDFGADWQPASWWCVWAYGAEDGRVWKEPLYPSPRKPRTPSGSGCDGDATNWRKASTQSPRDTFVFRDFE